MGLLNLFRKKAGKETEAAQETPAGAEESQIYSGMRAEVTALDGRLLFGAKLMDLRGDTAQLYQYSQSELPQDTQRLQVKIRGYNDHTRKAVYMEGFISAQPKHVWLAEELTIVRAANDRAFFRLDTNTDATVTTLSGIDAGEKPCKLLNISVGGACIGSQYQYREHDKFLLKVKLLEDRDTSVMFCEVLRVIVRAESKFEYGCQFLELSEADQGQITQNIFAVQRKKRGSYQ